MCVCMCVFVYIRILFQQIDCLQFKCVADWQMYRFSMCRDAF